MLQMEMMNEGLENKPNMNCRKHLNEVQKQQIWTLYQNGLVSQEIAQKIGCTCVTVCNWIRKLMLTNGKIEGVSKRIQKPRKLTLCPKPRRKPLKYNVEKCPSKQTQNEKVCSANTNALMDGESCKKMLQLYESCGSAKIVAFELQKDGIYLSEPTILKRLRQYVQSKKATPNFEQ
jgi:IS30 family transposase